VLRRYDKAKRFPGFMPLNSTHLIDLDGMDLGQTIIVKSLEATTMMQKGRILIIAKSNTLALS